jgi:DNA-binding transcriptional regulator YiaG
MYHYTECGLQNVWLENGYKKHKTPYGAGVSIEDVVGLHQLIGRAIARGPRLTGAELRFLRKELELSQRTLAGLLGISEQNVSLWERHGKIPKWGARLVKVLYMETLDGNVHVKKLIERLNEQDSQQATPLHFKTRDGHWKTAA